MWTVVLHYDRGNVQTERFENKSDALKFVEIAVFKNEDCVNCNIYKDTTIDTAVPPSIQATLDSIEWKLELVEKITSRF